MGGVVPPGALWAWGAERKGRPGSHGGGGGAPCSEQLWVGALSGAVPGRKQGSRKDH